MGNKSAYWKSDRVLRSIGEDRCSQELRFKSKFVPSIAHRATLVTHQALGSIMLILFPGSPVYGDEKGREQFKDLEINIT